MWKKSRMCFWLRIFLFHRTFISLMIRSLSKKLSVSEIFHIHYEILACVVYAWGVSISHFIMLFIRVTGDTIQYIKSKTYIMKWSKLNGKQFNQALLYEVVRINRIKYIFNVSLEMIVSIRIMEHLSICLYVRAVCI